MPRGYSKGSLILSKDGHRYSEIYRGIMEVFSRFGYASIKEIMYGFHLNLTQAVDRLRYLEQSGFIQRFPSRTVPVSFFCLTSKGRQYIENRRISDYIMPFHPRYYQLVYQEHHRAITKVFLALKRLLGDDFLYWTSESFLKVEGAQNRVKRFLDGELHLKIRKTFHQAGKLGGTVPALHLDLVLENWRCGVEVELSLKSPARYIKQFRDLARQIYTGYTYEQHYPMFLFFYSTKTIRDKLVHEIKEGGHNFGSCIFFLAQIDQFTTGLRNASAERWVYGKGTTIPAREISQVKILRS